MNFVRLFFPIQNLYISQKANSIDLYILLRTAIIRYMFYKYFLQIFYKYVCKNNCDVIEGNLICVHVGTSKLPL